MGSRNISSVGRPPAVDAMVASCGSQISRPSKFVPPPIALTIARVWMKYWKKLEGQIRDGTAPECFVKQFAESHYQDKGISEIQAAYLAGCTLPPGSRINYSND
jgi:hypothetical protein